LYVERAPSHLGSWLAAPHDPVVGPALVASHADPSRRWWTTEELAWQVACSRSTLNERFGRLLGRPPMQYLSDWRLHLAAGLLRDTPLAVAAVAHRVGYDSDEAFKRAFKRAMGALRLGGVGTPRRRRVWAPTGCSFGSRPRPSHAGHRSSRESSATFSAAAHVVQHSLGSGNAPAWFENGAGRSPGAPADECLLCVLPRRERLSVVPSDTPWPHGSADSRHQA
jgi:AraC-like DNA-binding protein